MCWWLCFNIKVNCKCEHMGASVKECTFMNNSWRALCISIWVSWSISNRVVVDKWKRAILLSSHRQIPAPPGNIHRHFHSQEFLEDNLLLTVCVKHHLINCVYWCKDKFVSLTLITQVIRRDTNITSKVKNIVLYLRNSFSFILQYC